MSLLARIDQDVKQAMIAKDQTRLDVLRFLKSAIKYVAIEKTGSEMTDADILQVIQKQIKQRQESIQQFVNGGRLDLSAKEKQELVVLEAYLPKQMPDDELKAFIDQQIKDAQASSKKDFGRVMKMCVEKLSGRADNKRISEALGKILQ